MQILIQCFI